MNKKSVIFGLFVGLIVGFLMAHLFGHYAIFNSNGQTFKINTISGQAWIYREDLYQWIPTSNR